MDRRILISTLALLALSTQTACTTSATSEAGDLGFNFATIGGLAGAGGGAYGASRLPLEGREQIAAIVGGTVLGGFIGYGIGAQIDKVDIAYQNLAAQRALVGAPGTRVAWSNPASGNAGSILATKQGVGRAGEECREVFVQTIGANRVDDRYEVLCRQPNGGGWRSMR
jgi:surface antigen